MQGTVPSFPFCFLPLLAARLCIINSCLLYLACFFLSLHDDRKNFFISLDSIKEMLGVLKQEFKDFVPFETDPKLLESYSTDDLVKL